MRNHMKKKVVKPKKIVKLKTKVNKKKIVKKIKKNVTKENNVYYGFIGTNIFARTVTYHYTGKVIDIVGDFFKLETSGWVADSGRFSETIKNGSINEFEFIGTMFLNISSCVDIIPWNNALPTETK